MTMSDRFSLEELLRKFLGGDLAVFADREQRVLAQQALNSLDERKNEDIDAWAEQLADDVCNATD